MTTMHHSEAIAQRLALLLAGDWMQADTIMHDVLRSQPVLSHVEVPLVRRLVILCARERVGMRTKTAKPWLVRVRESHRSKRGQNVPEQTEVEQDVITGIAMVAHRAASMLERQQFEAWLLHRIEDLDLRQVARCMDCSSAAVQRHLEACESSLRQTLGNEYADAIAQLRLQSRGAPTLPALLIARNKRVQRRSIRLWAFRVAAGIVLLAGVVLLWQLL